MKIQNVKGGYDYLPQEQIIRNYISTTLQTTFESFGYSAIETPILCYYDILSNKYEEENDILKEIYKLKDRGNRTLGLRYDLTVPFAKFIALHKNKIEFPFKRYEIAKVFRDGPVKVGRDREFTQCDVDVVGLSGQMIEAELILLYKEAFEKLDIPVVIKYNSRNLMTGLLIECGVKENNISIVTTLLDKLDKISKEEFKNNLLEIGFSNRKIEKLLAYFKLSLQELNQIFINTENEKIQIGLEELNNLYYYFKKLEIENICLFSSSLARGQNYYTGNIFEVYEASGKITCSIGGGGRYDEMITNFIKDGQKYPAVGISFGLTSIYELLKDKLVKQTNTEIYIIPIGTQTESLKLALKLRKMGFKVGVEMQERKVKKSLLYASKQKIPYVIVLGETELEKKQIKIKNMYEEDEKNISLNNLEEILKIIKKIEITNDVS